MLNTDDLLNDFAIRSFRDQADTDYVSARMASRAQLVGPFLWASQQTIEKYLKCILLLNRIPAAEVKHNLQAAIRAINASGSLRLDLSPASGKFVEHVDSFGQFRYLEVSNFVFGWQIIELDRTVWELRRYCTLSDLHNQFKLRKGIAVPNVRLPGGCLEAIIDDRRNPARAPLLLHNAFFGKKTRKYVKAGVWMKATNSPLYLHPEILDEVLKYVFLPRQLVSAVRAQVARTPSA
jgi:hypothetical protein